MAMRLNKHLGDYVVSFTLLTGMMVAVLGFVMVLSIGQSLLGRGHAQAAASPATATVVPASAPARTFAAEGGAA